MNQLRKRSTNSIDRLDNKKRLKKDLNISVSLRNTANVNFKLNKQIVNFLKTVADTSTNEQSEYAGIIDIYETSQNVLRYRKTEAYSSGNYASILPKPSLMKTYITYHSHPHPIHIRDYVAVRKDSRPPTTFTQNSFSLPSVDDFRVYITNYPNMQVNLILDRYGYYVIDFISPVLGERFKNDTFKELQTVIQNHYQTLVDVSIEGLYVTKYKNTMYLHSNGISNWKKFINTDYSQMLNKFGLRCMFYPYKEQADISITHAHVFMNVNNSDPDQMNINF
jgi:hypothetical protein